MDREIGLVTAVNVTGTAVGVAVGVKAGAGVSVGAVARRGVADGGGVTVGVARAVVAAKGVAVRTAVAVATSVDNPPPSMTTTGVLRTACPPASKIWFGAAARLVTPGCAFPERNRTARLSPAVWLTLSTWRPPLMAKSVSTSCPVPSGLVNTPRLKVTLTMDREIGLVTAVNVTGRAGRVAVGVKAGAGVSVGPMARVGVAPKGESGGVGVGGTGRPTSARGTTHTTSLTPSSEEPCSGTTRKQVGGEPV
jgi:hypothetical protein